MPFIHELLRYRSVAVVGLDKNVGKTMCLNYILHRLPIDRPPVAVTSIGLDGERTDQLTGGQKPAVRVASGTVFATSRRHLARCGVGVEVLDVSDAGTALGPVVTARALTDGEVLLSGPSSTQGLIAWIGRLERFGVGLTLVDGALGRVSAASPAATEAMILSTGAAYATDPATLVRRTALVVEKIATEAVDTPLAARLESISSGVWALTADGELHDTGLATTLAADEGHTPLPKCSAFYVAGALTDAFADRVRTERPGTGIVTTDFTRIFLSERGWRRWKNAGGVIRVLRRSRLIAICVNPTAPDGTVLDSEALCTRIAEATGVDAYDIVKNDYAV